MFIGQELRCANPAVDLRVLRHRSLAVGSVFSLVLGMGLYGTVFVVPVFAQPVLRYTPTQTGLLMLPGALASAATMAVLGKTSQHFDPRLLIALGAAAMVATMQQLAAICPDTGEASLFWPLILRGVTTVMMFLPLSLATLGPLPREDVGAGIFGIALLTVVLDHQRAVQRAQLVEHFATTNPLLQERLAMLSQEVDRQAGLFAYGDVFRVVGLVFLLALPLVLLLGRAERFRPPPGLSPAAGAGCPSNPGSGG